MPHEFGDALIPVGIDWINVWNADANPTANNPPKLRRFMLTSNSCGGPGFLYTADPDPNKFCDIGFTADVDRGAANTYAGTITVDVANDPDDRASTAKPGRPPSRSWQDPALSPSPGRCGSSQTP